MTKAHIPKAVVTRGHTTLREKKIRIGVTDGERTKYKRKTKVNHSILNLFLIIDLVILNMHNKFEVSNSDRADMMKNLLDGKKTNK